MLEKAKEKEKDRERLDDTLEESSKPATSGDWAEPATKHAQAVNYYT